MSLCDVDILCGSKATPRCREQIDKGKPIVRSGRKAMGLANRVRQAAEVAT